MDEALLLLVVRHEQTTPRLFVGESDGGTFICLARAHTHSQLPPVLSNHPGMGQVPGLPVGVLNDSFEHEPQNFPELAPSNQTLSDRARQVLRMRCLNAQEARSACTDGKGGAT